MKNDLSEKEKPGGAYKDYVRHAGNSLEKLGRIFLLAIFSSQRLISLYHHLLLGSVNMASPHRQRAYDTQQHEHGPNIFKSCGWATAAQTTHAQCTRHQTDIDDDILPLFSFPLARYSEMREVVLHVAILGYILEAQGRHEFT